VRIGIISRRFWPFSGPLEVEAADIAQAIASAGHQVEILTIHWEKNWPRRFQFREIEVVRFSRRFGGPWGMFRFLREMERYIAQTQFDALVVYGLAVETWSAVRNFAAKLPVALRIDEVEWNHFLARRFSFQKRRPLNQLARIWADSPQTQQVLFQFGVSAEIIEFVPPCIQLAHDFERSSTRRSLLRSCLSDTHPILEVEPQLPLVVCASSLEDEGIDHLLSAWKLVARHLPRARLWILGEGQLQHSVWQRVCDFDLANAVVMPGQFDELDDILVAADVYLHASVASLNSHAFARALASGSCVVAVANSFTQRYVENYCNGLIVPPANPPALAEALLQALRDCELRQRLGAAASEAGRVFHTNSQLERLLAALGTGSNRQPRATSGKSYL
jgi:glycosyltransferase involved in cell wall biosynthesis